MKEGRDGFRVGVQAWEQTSDAHVLPLRPRVWHQEVLIVTNIIFMMKIL